MKITQKLYSPRDTVLHPKTLFIFTDNTDRTSGKIPIPRSSWYYTKYGDSIVDLYRPTVTSACIRGCHNAFPISTQRHYRIGQKWNSGRWEDSDLPEFKETIDSEISDILEAAMSGAYTEIVIPEGGLFRRKISDISPDRCPELYQYLQSETMRLAGLVSLI